MKADILSLFFVFVKVTPLRISSQSVDLYSRHGGSAMDRRARVTDHGPRWRRASSGREHRQPLTTSQEDGHKRGGQSTHLPLTATDSEWAGGGGGMWEWR